MDKHMKLIDENAEKLRETTDPREKELLTEEFWLLAIDAFNENIAGVIRTAHGKTLNIPEI